MPQHIEVGVSGIVFLKFNPTKTITKVHRRNFEMTDIVNFTLESLQSIDDDLVIKNT